MIGDPQQEKQSRNNEGLVVRGSGLYLRQGREGEEYLYEAAHELPTVPTAEELRAIKGKVSRVRRQGQKVRKRTPGIVYLPLVADTEFQTLPNPEKYPEFHDAVLEKLQRINRGSIPLTVQLNTIRPTAAGISTAVHPLYLKAFPQAEPDLPCPKDPVIDYLKQLVPGTSIQVFDDLSNETLNAVWKTRKLRVDFFCHFAVADFFKVWPEGPIRDSLIKSTIAEEPLVDQGRRLKTEVEHKLKGGQVIRSRWIRVPAIVRLNGVSFALEVSVVDTAGMAGQAGASLAGFHSCAGVPMAAKDNYEKGEKETMLFQFIASCDRKGLEKGAYQRISESAPGVLNKALILDGAYSMGNRFIDYAEGDVETLYTAIDSFSDQFEQLYQSLGLDSYFRPPRFTVGSTVHDLLKASVFRVFEKDGQALTTNERKYLLSYGFEPARARGLAEGASWAAANARVFGGRVLSTAPTLVSRKNAAICDMDLAGAYARSMDVQVLPIGRPVIDLKFTSRSKRNHFPTLGEHLKKHQKELVPGCWQMLVSVVDAKGEPIELPSDQDYFTSWSTPAVFEGDHEEEAGIWLERSDRVKVYTRQITNAILTADGLDWLNYCCSRDLRKFILENARVKAFLYYPQSRRVPGDDPDELIKRLKASENDGRKNTSKVHHGRRHSTVTTTEREFHDWIGIKVSDLLTDDLGRERKRWKEFTKGYGTLRKSNVESIDDLGKLTPKNLEWVEYLADEHEGGHPGGMTGLIEAAQRGGKHPKDELAKLCSNTVYGDLVSRFFPLSNPAVGNNITARVRSIIWYFEKSCRAWNSITDGGLFDLNEIHTVRDPNRWKLTEKNTIFAPEAGYKALRESGIVLKPLGHHQDDPVIRWGWKGSNITIERQTAGVIEMDVAAAQKLIDQMTLEHVRNSFDHRIAVIDPKTSPFEFEAKGVVQDAAIHGTANYCLRGGKHDSYKDGKAWTIKLRSYPSSVHEKVLLPFFSQLIENPEEVDRTRYWEPFVLGQILKARRFRDSHSTYYGETVLEPGDTEYAIKMFREFTSSAFRFRTEDQEKKFNTFHEARRDLGNPAKPSPSARGQSFESFFSTKDGKLNYKQMMVEVEAAIRSGKTSIHPELKVLEHPRRQSALRLKKKSSGAVIRTASRYEHQIVSPLNSDLVDELSNDDWF